jgi:hypothetical protein
MVEYMLSNVICSEFEKVVGKGHSEDRKAMHIGFHLHPENEDQFCVIHMYIYAPGNYVYVAIQEEKIDEQSQRSVGKMKIICYHDSCWRDAVGKFIFENRQKLSTMKSFQFSDWYDVLNLSADEVVFLRFLDDFNMKYGRKKDDVFGMECPFDKRGIWAER